MSLLLTMLACLFICGVIEQYHWDQHRIGATVYYLTVLYAIYRIGEWFYLSLSPCSG